jgi:hypothetical protein
LSFLRQDEKGGAIKLSAENFSRAQSEPEASDGAQEVRKSPAPGANPEWILTRNIKRCIVEVED